MSTSDNKHVLILGPNSKSLINFRGELLKCFLNKGLHVTTVSSAPDEESLDALHDLGVKYQTISLKRNNLNFFDDIKTLLDISSIVKKKKPKFILAYGVKLVIWGGLSARASSVSFFALITGLGFAFQGDSFKRKLLTKLVTFLYKAALKNSKAVIFQNKDNRNIFIEKGIVPRSKTHTVDGSGVDINKYSVTEFPKTHVNFLCISRLLGEKGLREYTAAARIVKNKFPNTEFGLVGPKDSSPDAISLEEVNSWSDYVNYSGSTNDVRPYIEECHVYVLPSYHEGLPRSTLEAMSMGRPILTTSAVGCKETVEEGVNGFMVPIGSTIKLAEKMIWYIENKDKVQSMGEESRRIVENKFDVHKINKEMLRILGVE
jgi:glycosyltransferase involved in cell wall biosynthesis